MCVTFAFYSLAHAFNNVPPSGSWSEGTGAGLCQSGVETSTGRDYRKVSVPPTTL